MEKVPLINLVESLLPDSSKTTLKSMIMQKRISVDGFLCTKPFLAFPPDAKVELHKKNLNLKLDVDILYEDNDLVVVFKPAGLLSVEAQYETEETLHQVLKNRYKPGRVFVVHRLDREVSGVMLFARNEDTLWKLKALLKNKEIQRIYVALVEGKVQEDEGLWTSYLTEDEEYKVHASEEAIGVIAKTHFKVMKRNKSRTWLQIELQTGRKNQIRVQAASVGHPIVGDKKYEAKSNPIGQVLLFSKHLEFMHPIKEKKMVFDLPLPEEFQKLWDL